MEPAAAEPTPASNVAGEQVDEVTIDIDYKIIKHFSENLYSSPNKAIEELVVNGYDAFADWVQVFTPGRFTPDCLVVWDNGTSMDIEGLKTLWDIADSPKEREDGRVVMRDGREREVIGKFGIGKLASYTLGEKIAHLCKVQTDEEEKFYLVRVNYESVTSELQSEDQVFKSPIRELSEREALDWIKSRFEIFPDGLPEWFNDDTWTLAIVHELREDVNITEGRLKWVMGHAMPIRPDFKVFINESRVVPNYDVEEVNTEWRIGDKTTEEKIRSTWEDAVGEGEVEGQLTFDRDFGIDPEDEERSVPFVEFPALGQVWGSFRLYNGSLVEGRTGEYGRSYGFFIMVLGRLINTSAPKGLMGEPSYRTFYRANYVVHADGLDDVLLANRNDLKEDTPEARELKVLQRALYRITRARQSQIDTENAEDSVSQLSRFPTNSREHFIEPLSGLLMRRSELGEHIADFDITSPSFGVEPLGESSAVADLSSDGSGLSVNSDHPYHRVINEELGSGQVAEKARTEIERLSISERIFEGYLYDVGINPEKIDEIVRWREQMYRMLAQRIDRRDYAELSRALRNASHEGDDLFEETIVEMLEAMGFIAERDGSSGKKDIVMHAPADEQAYTLTVEAKGKNSGAVSNDEADVSGAANHRDEVGAEHTVIVARKFAGMEKPRPEGPAVLNECRSVGGASVMEVDTLIELARAMRRFHYSLGNPEVQKVFMEVETPAEKMERVADLKKPFDSFDYRELLEDIWKQQEELTTGRPVPLRNLFYQKYEDQDITLNRLKTKVSALEVLASQLIYVDDETQHVALQQSPEHIARKITVVLSDTANEENATEEEN